jgi:hypothetical protein
MVERVAAVMAGSEGEYLESQYANRGELVVIEEGR